MKQTNKNIVDIEDFEKSINLYSIVPSGKGRAVEFLRKIVDEIFAQGTKRPSVLIVGKEGKTLLAKAFINSLVIGDVRECDACYFDNGLNSKEFFENSLYDTAHILLNIEGLRQMSEATIWRYLRHGWCSYQNFPNRDRDYIHCNGIIVLTAADIAKVGKPILRAVKYTIHIEPYNQEQLFAICHQYLKIFCGIKYKGKGVLQNICEYGNGEVSRMYELLKLIMLVVKTDNIETVSENVVEKASRMRG